jgi:hypothetical protein
MYFGYYQLRIYAYLGDNMEKKNTVREARDKPFLQVKEEKKSIVKEVGDNALDQIEDILMKKPQGIVSISKGGENWNVQLEVLERKAIPDTQDILGIYEVKLDSALNVIEYKRIGMRHRGDMICCVEET